MRGFLLLLAASLLLSTGTSLAGPQKAKKPPVLKPVSAAIFKKEIAARRGKVVLVNFWATWCPGCVAEFPALVKLQKQYQKQGLAVMFVSADDAKDQKAKVQPFLSRHGVSTPTWIIKGSQFSFIPQFDPKLKGAFGLPRTYLYNRQGKLVKVIAEEKTYTQFSKLIKPLL